MPISFNTGTAVTGGGSSTLNQAITIPAGVLAKDVILVAFAGFRGSAAETIQASSTGTAPTIIGTTQTTTFSGNDLKAAIFYVVASATDAGKVITGSFVSGDTAQWAASMGAWTGVLNSAPIDVSGAAVASGASSTITCPSETTVTANDWAIQLLCAALGGSAYTGGAGFTQRESLVDAGSGAGTAIFDSNASVGPGGTSIGGANFANAGHNSWWAGFTVGLSPVPAPVVAAVAGGGGVSMMRRRLMLADL